METQRLLAYRRFWEGGFWVALLTTQAVSNSIVSNIETTRYNLEFSTWEPWIWEISSALMLALLIPLILFVDRRFPICRACLPRNLLVQFLCTIPFSILHVLGMVLLRELAYWMQEGNYNFGNWPVEFFYEYLKDARAYSLILALIYLYRFLLRRWQGEAHFLAQGVEEAPQQPITDRFLVKKLGREFLVKVEDIDWVESAGNYVTLHVGERLYPLRETMTNLEKILAARGFARVHRSAIVNLDRIREIEPLDNGDARVHLANGNEIPVSRRHRQSLI